MGKFPTSMGISVGWRILTPAQRETKQAKEMAASFRFL
jgi:hypothetical protein